MPPQLLFDINGIDLNAILFDQHAIRLANPQRGDMEHLNGIIHVNPERHQLIGFKDVRPDEFWVVGHIPGRPLLPGVLMIEAAAQLASFYTRKYCGWTGFIGFGSADEVKFRQSVEPGCRMHLLCAKIWERHHRMCSAVQGLVNGNLVFEAKVTGVEF